VLSDFEPLSTRIAKKFGIPSIGVSHQCAFHYDVPKARFNYPGKFVTRVFAPVDINIGLHWHHFNQPIMPPIVDTSMNPKSCAVEQGKALVYLPFEKREQVRNAFLQFPDRQFHVYEKRDQQLVEQNTTWNPFSRDRFQQDLLSCDGVICQSGFELPSEALHLGKKLLVKPVHGQFEQLSNAMVIDRYEFGMTMNKLDTLVMEKWFAAQHPEPASYPDVARGIAEWVGAGDWSRPANLAARLWADTHIQTHTLEAANAA